MLSASSWMARSAAVTVPAPEQAPKRITGFIFRTYRPNSSAVMCGVTATMNPTTSRLGPICLRPATKLGPALRPTTPMKTARPTVSNTQSAGSGIRPKVGRTDRSQPNTRPMMSAPPLAVRLKRQGADHQRQRAQQSAGQDAEADEDDVGFARRPLDVAERAAGPLDVGLRAGKAEQVAAVEHRVRPRTGSPLRRGRAS